jgi:hypothetical protein
MTTSATKLTRALRKAGVLQDAVPSFDTANFGFRGIRARYRDKPGRLLRSVDPFAGELVEFSSPLQYENWLLRRFDPSIIYLDSSHDSWEVLHGGDQLAIRPDLHWAGWSDRGFLEIVEEPGRKVSNAVLDSLAIIANAHGLKPLVRVAAQVRADPDLLDFLDRTRQNLVLFMREIRDTGLRKSVLTAVGQGPSTTRADVVADLAGRIDESTIDAVLFWLRQSGVVHFDITGGVYDDRTAIAAA